MLWFHHPHQRPVWSKVNHNFDTCWYQIITHLLGKSTSSSCSLSHWYTSLYASISPVLKLPDLLIWISDPPPRLQYASLCEGGAGGETQPPFPVARICCNLSHFLHLWVLVQFWTGWLALIRVTIYFIIFAISSKDERQMRINCSSSLKKENNVADRTGSVLTCRQRSNVQHEHLI